MKQKIRCSIILNKYSQAQFIFCLFISDLREKRNEKKELSVLITTEFCGPK